MPLTVAAYSRERLVEAMLHSDYPLQALLYVVVRAPLPALASARLRPGPPPRRCPLPLRARHVRSRHPGGGRPSGGRLLVAPAGRAGDRALRPAGRCSRDRAGARGPLDHRLARSAGGVLGTFNAAGLLDASDVHVAQRLSALAEDDDPLVALGVAFVVRAVRAGSVCVDLGTVARGRGRPWPWPDPAEWYAAIAASPLVTSDPPVLRMLERRRRLPLYLDRYWREEEQVHADLVGRPSASRRPRRGLAVRRPRPGVPRARATTSSEPRAGRAHPGHDRPHRRTRHRQDHDGRRPARAVCRAGRSRGRPPSGSPSRRRPARPRRGCSRRSRRRWPGFLPSDQARLSGVRAVTLHRLLGSRPDTSSRFRHHRDNRLPHDVVVVDETSMVSLTMMARLLEAVRPGSRLILVGDPFQLASVEAGAVLADLVEAVQERHGGRRRLAGDVASLRAVDRRAGGGRAPRRRGHSRRSCEAGGEHVELVSADDPTPRVRELVAASRCRHRSARPRRATPSALSGCWTSNDCCARTAKGPYGVHRWNLQVERWLGEETGEPIWSTVVRRPTAARDRERLRPAHLQRRHRRGGPAAGQHAEPRAPGRGGR